LQTFCPGGEIGRLAILRGWFSQGSAGSNPVQGTLIYFMAFRYFSNKDILDKTKVRQGETKVGEVIACYQKGSTNHSFNYVIVGIPEDIGIIANYGNAGAKNTFEVFLNSFLNLQNNQFIEIKSVCIGGFFDFNEIEKKVNISDIHALRDLVSEIDHIVSEKIQEFVLEGLIPIIIGGGHNNSYPIINGVSKGLNKKLNIVNIDPHFDFRALEGRHSGNGFSYAFKEGLIKKYGVFGYHQNYNNQTMLNELKDNAYFQLYSFEDFLFVNYKENLMDTWNAFLTKYNGNFGLEIDMDSIANMPASAYTPTGFSIEQVRQLLYFASKRNTLNYVHIAEAKAMDQNQYVHVGKAIALLIADIFRK